MKVLPLLLLIPFSLFASEAKLEDLSLEELLDIKVTSASQFEETLSESSATVEKIDRKMMRKRGVQRGYELFEFTEGVQNYATMLGIEGIVVRGLGAGNFRNGIALVLDDIPLSSLEGGSGQYLKSSFALPFFESTELVKGPGSTLYGSDAFFGAQNSKTIGVDHSSWEWTSDLSSKNYRSLSLLSPGVRFGKFKFFAGYGYAARGDQKQEFSYTNPSAGNKEMGRRKNAFEDHNLKLETSFQPTALDKFVLSLYAYKRRALESVGFGRVLSAGYSQSTLREFDKSSLRDARFYMGNLLYQKNFSENVEASFNIYGFQEKPELQTYINLNSTTVGVQSTGAKEKDYGGMGKLKVEIPSLKNRFVLGFDYKHYFIDDTWIRTQNLSESTVLSRRAENYDHAKRVSKGFYFQGKQELFSKSLNLHLGGRFDAYSNIGSEFSPRAALVWAEEGPYAKTFKLSYAHAFRAPNATEVYGSFSIPSAPGLKPETFDTYEFVSGKRWNNFSLYGTIYFSEWKKQIQALMTGAVNSGYSVGYGTELKALYKWKRLDYMLAGSYGRSKNLTIDSFYDNFPNLILTTSLQYSLPWYDIESSLDGRYTNDMKTGGRYAVKQELPHYFLVNLNLNKKMADWNLWFRVRNLFDRENYNTSFTASENGLELERRSFLLGLDYNI